MPQTPSFTNFLSVAATNISNFTFLTMHRLYVLFRPDHLLIWFGFKIKYTFLDLRENK